MTAAQISTQEWLRLQMLFLLFVVAIGLLGVRLWRMQVSSGADYETSLEQQSMRRVRIPGARGRIFDRQGVCLADNKATYGIAVYLEELRHTGKKRVTVNDAWALIQKIGRIIGREPEITRKKIESHLYNRKALPLVAWRHVDETALARLAELGPRIQAADVVVDSERVYPQGAMASHLLGYVSMAELQDDKDDKSDKTDKTEEDDERYHYYVADMIGKSGLESRFDELLAGRPGGRLVRVDVSGYRFDESNIRESVAGGDLQLSIDVRIQRAAERVLADTVGAAVVVNPVNGDVLALASSPGFNPNEFCPVLPASLYMRLVQDPHKPLFNRAVGGAYAPGSIFKPLVALAALESGKANAQTTFDCGGSFELGGHKFSCYMGESHGLLDIRHALEQSCNVFFYQLGLLCGYDPIHDMAQELGLGAKTGIDFSDESAGLLPSKAWKRARYNESWVDGDTCNFAIGQGALMVTPLQMAMMTAALANGGRLYKPRLMLGRRGHGEAAFVPTAPELVRSFDWAPRNLALVRNGMRDVIQADHGTGRLSRHATITMAGKTGTAEFGKKGGGLKHGWMILFAPFEQPRYAVAVVMDEAFSGGQSVGPRMGALMREIFDAEQGGAHE